MIHDKIINVLKGKSSDHTITYLVEDFSGLFPVWPIIKFNISLCGNTKDEMMNQYVWGLSAIFREILIVNKKATIAPVEIMNNKAKDIITNRPKIPTNFTKLGKWLSMSGGSWVFNKKESNVYAHLRLKLTIPADEMVMRVSFKFLQIGGSKLYLQEAESGNGN
jgi:hypothetical protein